MPEAKLSGSNWKRVLTETCNEIPIQAQRKVLSEIHSGLKAEPFREIKTRIKRLTGIVPPLYRLRIGDYRAYSDRQRLRRRSSDLA